MTNAKLASEKVILEAPMSFTGSAKRLWRMSDQPVVKWFVLLPIIGVAWCFIICWYAIFGLLLIPYRLVRRSQRSNKKRELQHRELLEQLQKP